LKFLRAKVQKNKLSPIFSKISEGSPLTLLSSYPQGKFSKSFPAKICDTVKSITVIWCPHCIFMVAYILAVGNSAELPRALVNLGSYI
jgi:hypothetical protein